MNGRFTGVWLSGLFPALLGLFATGWWTEAGAAASVAFDDRSYRGVDELPPWVSRNPHYLEDFEDGQFNLPGLKVRDQGPITASPLAPSSSTRSMEPGGYSFGPLFEFVAPVLPSLHHSQIELSFEPWLGAQQRHVFGFALTSLPADAHFSIRVFDDEGLLLGEFGQWIEVFDSSRFFSVESSAPIGAGADEVMFVQGDSGGPMLINDRIAGIGSWYAGFQDQGSPDVTPGIEPDGSFGEIASFMRMSFYANWYDQQVGRTFANCSSSDPRRRCSSTTCQRAMASNCGRPTRA